MNNFKRLKLVLIICMTTSLACAQSQKSFEKLVSQTNEYLEKYSRLSPLSTETFFALKESGLPKEVVKYIRTNHEEFDGYSKDSISEFNLLLEFQGLIISSIEEIIAHNRFIKNDIEQLISTEFDMSIIVSEDKKLYNFSLDEKTGGTYRSRISIMHYTEIDRGSLPTQQELDTRIKISPYTAFEGDGLTAIYSIKTEEGTKYVATGYVRGCSYCFETNIMLVQFRDGLFMQDFAYSVNSRSSEEGVSYDPLTKTITVDYVTDDLTTDCDCSAYTWDEDEAYYERDTYETDFIEKECHCTYEFNGLNFELTKERWEKAKQ